ncbi:MAG: RNA methyltransferase [Bacteroidetes bacterium]|nr:RNA methyltransferase [Bacteroidota bacterium]
MRIPLTRQQAVELGKLRLKKYREEQGHFLLEGERLIADALAASAPIERVVVSAGREQRYASLLEELETAGVPVLTASEKLLERITDTRQPQGLAAVAPILPTDAAAAIAAVPTHIPVAAFWGVADPGNFGTAIRSADWFGSRGILYSAGSADPFNPKTVRSSMGSLFRVSLGEVADTEALLALAAKAGRVPVATTATDGVPADSWPRDESVLLVFGSEAHGLPDELLARVPRRIRIPGGGAESLNLAVAHAVFMYALR